MKLPPFEPSPYTFEQAPDSVSGGSLMQYISAVTGEGFAVVPSCVHPMLAAYVNAASHSAHGAQFQELVAARGLVPALTTTATADSAHLTLRLLDTLRELRSPDGKRLVSYDLYTGRACLAWGRCPCVAHAQGVRDAGAAAHTRGDSESRVPLSKVMGAVVRLHHTSVFAHTDHQAMNLAMNGYVGSTQILRQSHAVNHLHSTVATQTVLWGQDSLSADALLEGLERLLLVHSELAGDVTPRPSMTSETFASAAVAVYESVRETGIAPVARWSQDGLPPIAALDARDPEAVEAAPDRVGVGAAGYLCAVLGVPYRPSAPAGVDGALWHVLDVATARSDDVERQGAWVHIPALIGTALSEDERAHVYLKLALWVIPHLTDKLPDWPSVRPLADTILAYGDLGDIHEPELKAFDGRFDAFMRDLEERQEGGAVVVTEDEISGISAISAAANLLHVAGVESHSHAHDTDLAAVGGDALLAFVASSGNPMLAVHDVIEKFRAVTGRTQRDTLTAADVAECRHVYAHIVGHGAGSAPVTQGGPQ